MSQWLSPIAVDWFRLLAPAPEPQQRMGPETQMHDPLHARLTPHLVGRDAETLLGVLEPGLDREPGAVQTHDLHGCQWRIRSEQEDQRSLSPLDSHQADPHL